ncbi:MAG TPA: ATP-dependent DNA ligase [Opitutaceae bacterium]|nr:ATP-dependent DNA ligase [Opitutaceae bacterium]
MAWQIEFRNGVWLPQIGWHLDAHFPTARSFVSHAHFDHLATHREIICSEGTARLMRARMPGQRIEHVLAFGQTEALSRDCAITLHPAGHIFGSAQSLLAHEQHGTLLYTGDFKLRRGLSAEACATPRADTLIMETTYGKPHYVLPPTERVLADIIRFCREALEDGETPVLFGYSLGKSQELLSSFANAKLPVMLHPQTCKLTQVYEEMGLTFPPYRAFSLEEVAGHVVICPPQSTSSAFLRKISPRRTAMITGWALDAGAIYRYQCDAAFPLSDHADYTDLLRFVDLVQPKRVLTLHGFAREFAQTLRERGIEAWAIGQDNQLEFEIGSRTPPAEPPPAARDLVEEAVSANESSVAIDAFGRFALVADQLKTTDSKLEKIGILRDYLASLAPEDAALAALFLTARAFPQADERKLTLGWSVLRRALFTAANIGEAEFRAAYQRFPDPGDAVEAMLSSRSKTTGFSLTLRNVAALFDELAAARGPTAKLDLLQARIAGLSPIETKYLVKIILGDLRIGLKEGLVEEAISAASGQPLEAVREAAMLCGDMVAVTQAALTNGLEKIQLRVFNPLQFMLASPEPTADAMLARLSPPVWLEEKYDGIRCQVHKLGDRVELFSRDLHRITGQFPDIARAALKLSRDFIIDGELLAWRDGRALPFAELQKRLGRKGDDFFLGAEIPVSVSAYDLLWLDGRTLLKEPLSLRRELLAGLLSHAPDRFSLAPVQQATTALDIEAAFLASRQRGNEGLIAKDPRSLYTPGRRGLAWLKLKKAYATLDVVVVRVEYGHGKRRDVISDYTFAIRDTEHQDRLLTVGKAYSGLTDVEIAQLTQHFLDHTLEVQGRARKVVPDVVLEIAFDSIQPSARHESGFALRFPRIARIRTDKTPAEIDTLETCRRLAGVAASTAAQLEF